MATIQTAAVVAQAAGYYFEQVFVWIIQRLIVRSTIAVISSDFVLLSGLRNESHDNCKSNSWLQLNHFSFEYQPPHSRLLIDVTREHWNFNLFSRVRPNYEFIPARKVLFSCRQTVHSKPCDHHCAIHFKSDGVPRCGRVAPAT